MAAAPSQGRVVALCACLFFLLQPMAHSQELKPQEPEPQEEEQQEGERQEPERQEGEQSSQQAETSRQGESESQASRQSRAAAAGPRSAAGAERPIAYMAHGSYVDAHGELIPDPSQAALDAFFDTRGPEVSPRAPLPAPRDYDEYCRDCLAEDVPEPPAFDSGLWQSKGPLPDVFTSKPVVAILVYESDDPAGVCVALPRKDPGSPDIELVGVICQSERTGKACFWDNKSNRDPLDRVGSLIQRPTIEAFDIREFRNGDELFEDCTNCHRGQNVFIVHDALERIPRRGADRRYQPIPAGTKRAEVGADNRIWSNPGRRSEGEGNLMRTAGCGGCHTMSSQSWNYCSAVLRPTIARGLMPPGGLSASDRESLACRDYCLLQEECVLLAPSTVSAQQVRNMFGSASSDCDCGGWWRGVSGIASARPD